MLKTTIFPLCYYVLLCYSGLVNSKKLPPDIPRCSKSDPNFTECFRRALQDGFQKLSAGNKELGLNKLEPFYVPKLDLGDSRGGSVSLQQIYENVYIHGMTTSGELQNMEADFTGNNCFWRFNAVTPVLRMESDYTIRGKVLIFPINGHGTCNNTLYELDVKHDMTCERYVKKNKTYLKMTGYSLEMNPKKVVFDFRNIVEGNQQLSDEILKTINENSLGVYSDVKNGFGKAFSEIYIGAANNFFMKVPEDELFLP